MENKKIYLIIIAVVGVLGLMFAYYFAIKASDKNVNSYEECLKFTKQTDTLWGCTTKSGKFFPKSGSTNNKPTPTLLINSFEECEKSGGIIMESSPRQCRTSSGKTFVEKTTQIANPASEYCISKGGRLDIRTDADGGQIGYCIFGTKECEEWAYYRGTCSVE